MMHSTLQTVNIRIVTGKIGGGVSSEDSHLRN